MKSLKDIQEIVTQFNVKPRPEMRSKVLDEALEVQRSREQQGFSGTYRWRIIMKSRATKFATVGAMMAIAVLVGVSFLNGVSAWAKVIKAFNEVENVHIIQRMVMADGTVQEHEFWVRRPNCLYQDSYNRIVIDDGQERLTIDKENKTAQFSDSFMSYNRPEEYSIYESIKLFRGEGREEVELAKLDDEGDESTLVFSMHYQHSTIEAEGKAWVDALTMLPRKIQVELIREPRVSEPKSGEVIFNYEPIADDVFAMVIPEGFTELPRKQRGVMSGKVLDENEQPVANAIVYGTDRAGQFSEQTITDESGQFTFELLPEGVGAPLWLPVLFRAFVEGVPDKIAWSIIKDPASKDEPGGHIPYNVTHIDNDGCILKSAYGITLRMERAGTIAGQVTDVHGAPIFDAKVELLRCDLADKHGNAGLFGVDVHKWSGPGELGIVRTEETGRYELNNLPRLWKRTKVFIQAEAEGFVSDTRCFYAKGPIEHEEVNFQLYHATITVTGTLVDNHGQAIDGQYVYVIANGKSYTSCGTKTDKNGRFTLYGCPDTSDFEIKAELCRGYDRSRQAKVREYAPNVVVPIDYLQGKTVYEVEMIAERPDLILNVEVRNTSGEVLKYFPVEIRSDAAEMSTNWQVEKKFKRRTDKKGKCTFTEVPRINGLKLVLHGDNRIGNEKPGEETKRYIDENSKKYFWSEAPIEIRVDQKEYNMTAVALTSDEYKNQRKAH